MKINEMNYKNIANRTEFNKNQLYYIEQIYIHIIFKREGIWVLFEIWFLYNQKLKYKKKKMLKTHSMHTDALVSYIVVTTITNNMFIM